MKFSEVLKFTRPLRDHQTLALDRFGPMSEMALLWEMGTGKTTSGIAWLRAKYNANRAVTRTLIISPVATLYNWQDEFGINSPASVQAQVLVPYMKTKKTKYTGKERAKIIDSTDKNIIILNPECLDSDEVLKSLQKWCPVNLLLDEAHRFKSYRMTSGNGKKKNPSRLAKLLTISDRAQNRAIMTGTPILNSYLDLWSQWRILDRGATLGNNVMLYRETYFYDANKGMRDSAIANVRAAYFPDWKPKPGIGDILSELLARKSSRITKDECLDLPPLVEENYYVEMGKEQEKAYFDMENTLVAEVTAGTCAAVNALSKMNKMMQILAGHIPVETDDTGDKYLSKFKDNPRLEAVKELLTTLTPNHKVIIWVGFTANYPEIRAMCEELGLNHAELTGQTKNRQEQMVKFQTDPTCRAILSHPKAGGTGVNLTAASYAIRHSYDHNLGDWLQSEARDHRGGSEIHEKITHINLVVRGTMQEDILASLQRKENYADNVLERIKNLLAK